MPSPGGSVGLKTWPAPSHGEARAWENPGHQGPRWPQVTCARRMQTCTASSVVSHNSSASGVTEPGARGQYWDPVMSTCSEDQSGAPEGREGQEEGVCKKGYKISRGCGGRRGLGRAGCFRNRAGLCKVPLQEEGAAGRRWGGGGDPGQRGDRGPGGGFLARHSPVLRSQGRSPWGVCRSGRRAAGAGAQSVPGSQADVGASAATRGA